MANTSRTIRTAATLTTGAQSSTQDNPYHKGVTVTVTTADKASSASLVVKLQGKDANGTWYDLPGAATAAITTNTTTRLTVYPGIAATANTDVSTVLPRSWRLDYAISGGTFTVGAYAAMHE